MKKICEGKMTSRTQTTTNYVNDFEDIQTSTPVEIFLSRQLKIIIYRFKPFLYINFYIRKLYTKHIRKLNKEALKWSPFSHIRPDAHFCIYCTKNLRFSLSQRPYLSRKLSTFKGLCLHLL